MGTVRRFDHIPGFNIDRVAAAAGDDPEVLRMENSNGPVERLAVLGERVGAAFG
jgi:hypothetical protein